MWSARSIWKDEENLALILAAGSVLLIGSRLGAAELWTQEGRWAVICMHMQRAGDYLHPRLFQRPYDDKPLLSYWLMIGAARTLGSLSELALRLPSALSGLLALWCTYALGSRLFDRRTGLVAASLLATSAMFVFWSRVASADMMNIAATVSAVTWYFHRRGREGSTTYLVFWSIVAAGCLTKGLIAAAVVLLVLVPDLVVDGAWRRHLRPSCAAGLVAGAVIYFTPFVLSALASGAGGAADALQMVFRENVVRYVDPFDHQEPFYVYFLYLPIYLLPWSILLPLARLHAARERRRGGAASRWAAWAAVLVFAFLTGSGSRRSYYILPILPFAILVIADWVVAQSEDFQRRVGAAMLATWCGLVVWFGIVTPLSFRWGGERMFAEAVRTAAERKAPWSSWKLLLCGALPSVAYYVQTDDEATAVNADDRSRIEAALREHPLTILVTKRKFLDEVRAIAPQALVIEEPARVPSFLQSGPSERSQVALIP